MPSNTKATKISATFKELDNQIGSFTSKITKAESVARKFDAALKLDPKNIEVAQQKYESYSNALKNANDRLEAAQKQLVELNKVFADNKDADEYKSTLADTTKKIQYFTAEVERLKTQVKNSHQELERANPKLKSFRETLKDTAKDTKLWGDTLKSARVVILAMIAGVVKLTKDMANLGKELTANAKKYDTTVEKLQEQSYLFYTLTGNADAYTSSLQAMNSVMAQILSGRGQSQLQSLAQIGLKKRDIEGKSTAEAYEVVFNALRDVEDQATATAVAVKLFGDAGAYVAEMAQTSDEEFNKYLENFKKVGGLSDEAAQKLAELSDDLYLLKYQLQITGAELIVNLSPAIISIVKLLASLAEAVSFVYKTFGTFLGTMITVSTILTIKMIPSIIKLIIQTKLETAATWAQVAAKVALVGVITLGIGAIVGLGAALAASASVNELATSEMDNYTESINNATDAVKEYDKVTSKLNTDLSVSTENIEKTNSTYSSDVTFTIKAEGNTPISEENAKQIGEITVDQINKALGGIIV